MKEKCKYDSGRQLAIGSKQFMLSIAYCLLLILIFVGCREKKQNDESQISTPTSQIYYCPMHPEIMQNHPGKCPKPDCMGMDLMIKTNDTLLENVLKTVNASVLASVKTINPVFQKMHMDVEADGYIDYDDRAKNNISSLVSGRIEKLYLRYNYQPVRKGEKVFEIYSPELVTAQENLVYLLNTDPDEISLINAVKQKLKLLGITDDLLTEIVKTKKVMQTVPIYSKYEGHIQETNDRKLSSEMNSRPSAKQEISVKEGQYVMMGETIFNVVNENALAVIIQVTSDDIPKIHIGQETENTVEGGMPFRGKIDFIEPLLRQNAKTMSARIYFENKNYNYKVGSLVKIKIKGEEFETLWVPLSAVMDLGNKKIVWEKGRENYIAKKVETGVRSGNMIEIADGLTEESVIAAEAHYLTDSEGFIKENENE